MIGLELAVAQPHQDMIAVDDTIPARESGRMAITCHGHNSTYCSPIHQEILINMSYNIE